MSSGKHKGKPRRRSPAQKSAQRIRTSANKIRVISRVLLHAGGSAVGQLQLRLAYWKGRA